MYLRSHKFALFEHLALYILGTLANIWKCSIFFCFFSGKKFKEQLIKNVKKEVRRIIYIRNARYY